MLKLGKSYGYGNLIAVLREAWVDLLMHSGLSEKAATSAALTSPRSRKDRGKQ